jgi:hypothetical protein
MSKVKKATDLRHETAKQPNSHTYEWLHTMGVGLMGEYGIARVRISVLCYGISVCHERKKKALSHHSLLLTPTSTLFPTPTPTLTPILTTTITVCIMMATTRDQYLYQYLFVSYVQ